MRIRLLGMFAVSLLLVSCGTFPSRQLSLDVSDETVPVMLSEPQPEGSAHAMSFESGYNSVSVTRGSTYGGATTTTTTTVSADLNKPLDTQLVNVLVQEPGWIYVTSLTLTTDQTEAIWFSSVSYILGLDLEVAAGK